MTELPLAGKAGGIFFLMIWVEDEVGGTLFELRFFPKLISGIFLHVGPASELSSSG